MSLPPSDSGLRLEAFGPGDLPLVRALMGDPVMTEHLGGPETEAKLVDRHERYMGYTEAGQRMFKIVDAESGDAVGSVGYWRRDWRGEQVYETGWSVLPPSQGRGIAVAATRLAIEAARADALCSAIHAFPNVTNAPSNAICRKLGFTLVEEAIGLEYPKGHPIRCNDWRLEL